MKITRYSSRCLAALLALISLGTALADSTDEALNQFYVDNMAARLTSEALLLRAKTRLPPKRGLMKEKIARA